MPDLKIKTRAGSDKTIADAAVQKLKTALRGRLAMPGATEYNEARTLWNGMIDRKPAVIARCASAEDVVQAVRFAREFDVLVAVRGGGHNIAGNAVCDGGFMIDLTPMKDVKIDQAKRTARVEPGVTLGEFDAKAQAFGLATPLGINSTTGVAGLTLGGGFG